MSAPASQSFPAFDRRFLEGDENFTVIGTGDLGGKATGLAFAKRMLADRFAAAPLPGMTVSIPTSTVLGTDVFAQFMEQNQLYEVALSDAPDDRLAHAFLKAELPPLVLGDLRALIAQMQAPLAIRSSSLLEDALRHPFAGTYATKMIPNNQADVQTRFHKLTEAIKFVYASTFFRDARAYLRSIGRAPRDERMAVLIQEVVGARHNERFYPTLSGVIRTHNFYPTGPARAADGVASLALGLGKTIVDGGLCWSYAPRYPRHSPPFGSVGNLLKNSQTEFWAVNMGAAPPYDPVNEAEYLVSAGLDAAEYDGTLRYVASTYDAASDRLSPGTGFTGPRVLNFAPLLDLEEVRLNDAVLALADLCRSTLGAEVEIEFAATLEARQDPPARIGFLQVRPMLISTEPVQISAEELRSPRVLVASTRVLGNGVFDQLRDAVYVRPERFEARHTRALAYELAEYNGRLLDAGRHYVLIGFGRWGSSDPWLGIPVTWPQISGARVIVEATLPDMNVDPSQGTHFFHNMTSFRVQYFTVHHAGPQPIDWAYLDGLPAEFETELVRHVRTPAPLVAKVDGREAVGVILRP